MAPKKEENRGYEILRADLKAGTLKNVYLFYGEERYLCHTMLEQVRKALLPAGLEAFNHHRLNGREISLQTLAETVEAMPMMAEHTLVEVTDLDLFKLDETARNQLVELLTDFSDYCTLIFIYDTIEFKRDSKMKKLCAALDEFVCEVEFRQQESAALYKWIRQHVAASGHEIDSAAIEHLVFTCGSMMTNLAPEIEKINAYAKEKSITVSDINAVADPILDARVFDMTSAITAGRYDDAAKILGDLLRMQTEPIIILAAIGKELRQLYTARMALDGGKDRFWLKELWHMKSDYPAKLKLQAAAKVSHAWCAAALKKTQILDRRMKSEKGMDSEEELKLFLMELAGAR